MKTKLYTVPILCLSLLSGMLFVPKADAQTTSLRMQPSNLQIRAKTPAEILAPFTIENAGNEAIDLTIALKTFTGSDDESGKIVYTSPLLAPGKDKDPFFQNVQILDGDTAVTTLSLGPLQEKNLTLAIMLASNVTAGDHYFSLIFLTTPATETPSGNSVSQVRSGIALPVLLSVNQGKETTGLIEDFSAPWVMQGGPVPFTVRLGNSGEHFITAKSVLLIKNMFGQAVGRIDIPTTDLLAGSVRTLSNAHKLPSVNKADGKVVWPEKFLLGFYTATLTVGISPEESLYTREIHFFAFPLSLLVVLIILTVLGLLFFRRIRKKLSEV
jgi:hypothetical protein